MENIKATFFINSAFHFISVFYVTYYDKKPKRTLINNILCFCYCSVFAHIVLLLRMVLYGKKCP